MAGVLNVTPDSFSDGGRFVTPEAAVSAALQMVEEGAHWIDVGGESTRPGAPMVSPAEERARVLPVIEALVPALAGRAWVSIDTYKAETAEAALQAGARVVNDVSGGLMDPEILRVAARHEAPIVLGHLRGTPQSMMEAVAFDDVVSEVQHELAERVAAARAAGCARLFVDPGIGFGKRLAENLALMRGLEGLRKALKLPMMLGVSRKRFIGELTGRNVNERGMGTAAALAWAVAQGVECLRVHDVAAAKDVVAVSEALLWPPRGPG